MQTGLKEPGIRPWDESRLCSVSALLGTPSSQLRTRNTAMQNTAWAREGTPKDTILRHGYPIGILYGFVKTLISSDGNNLWKSQNTFYISFLMLVLHKKRSNEVWVCLIFSRKNLSLFYKLPNNLTFLPPYKLLHLPNNSVTFYFCRNIFFNCSEEERHLIANS